MRTIRINELARELEVKPKVILELLPEVGVTEKKTHSSSIDEDVAHLVKRRAVELGYSSVPLDHPLTTEPPAAPPRSAPPQAAQTPASETVREAPAGPAAPAAGEPAESAPASAPAAPATPPQTQFRPVAAPIRPPLAGARPAAPAAPPQIPVPPAAPTPAPPAAAAPPPSPAAPQVPPAAMVTPSMPAAPAEPASPGMPRPPAPPRQPAGGPARNQPIYRPGQVVSGPRQPMPPAENRPAAQITPGAPRPMPQPGAPRPAVRPGAPSGITVPRPAAGTPGAPQAPGAQGRPALVGQPAARPVVPPRPDLLARIQQTRPVPGQAAPAAPRPGMPTRPSSPTPGQPIYRGPIRPGQPQMRGPGMPGRPMGPGGPGRGPRPMHPTGPMRVEPATPPPVDTRRPQARRGAAIVRDKDKEGIDKFAPRTTRRQQDDAQLAAGKEITIAEGITVKELSEKLALKASLIIRKLVDKKIFATINQTLDTKLADEIARSFGAKVDQMTFEEEATQEIELTEGVSDLVSRAPVVTIMGHVDHGKTSLLDSIRETNVAAREAGGITQHIGAYSVETSTGRKIVFIDTPGHEAFTRMRARGAKVTDIVILVVAADDGVMPQTLEAIDHAKAAKVPIIVAINKVDRPDAQPERIKQQLADRNLLAEDWGGDTVMVPVSAKTKQNIDLLLEMILLVTDMQNFKANPNRPGIGTVLEAKLDRGRGPVATVLVQNGTLKVGDFFICGQVFGKVRAMYDDRGAPVREAEPSTPVEVVGLDDLPEVGDAFQVVTDTAKAKQIVVYREARNREQSLARGARVSLEQLHQQLAEGDTKELNIVLKTDVGGTAEVLAEMLQKLSTEKVRIRVISRGVGAITESDVLLASTSDAIIIGFNVRPERQAATAAELEKVDIRLHTIIYELTDEIRKAMTGMLEPVFKEAFRGRATVQQIFRISRVGTVAGCIVNDGTITRDSQVRLLRDNIVIHTGKVDALKRFKNDVSEVKSGFECGISLVGYNDIREGDVIEAFVMERIAASL